RTAHSHRPCSRRPARGGRRSPSAAPAGTRRTGRRVVRLAGRTRCRRRARPGQRRWLRRRYSLSWRFPIAREQVVDGLVDYAIAQHADIFGLDLDDVAGFEVTRRIEARAGAGRRSRDDDIACYQRGEGRDVVDEIAEAEDQLRSAVVLPHLAVDPRRQPDVGDLRLARVRHQPRAEAAGGLEILALRHVEFRVPDPVADGALIAQRHRGNVIQRRTLGDVPAVLADYQNHFALVVELA